MVILLVKRSYVLYKTLRTVLRILLQAMQDAMNNVILCHEYRYDVIHVTSCLYMSGADVMQVLNDNVGSSYSQSCVSPQGNPRIISHVREHNNNVQEINFRTNPSGHDSIGNNLQCDGIHHGDSHPTGI